VSIRRVLKISRWLRLGAASSYINYIHHCDLKLYFIQYRQGSCMYTRLAKCLIGCKWKVWRISRISCDRPSSTVKSPLIPAVVRIEHKIGAGSAFSDTMCISNSRGGRLFRLRSRCIFGKQRGLAGHNPGVIPTCQ
jgi:hypothetical protein